MDSGVATERAQSNQFLHTSALPSHLVPSLSLHAKLGVIAFRERVEQTRRFISSTEILFLC